MPSISPVDQLIQRLDKFFSIRDRSEKELRDYFRIKNYRLKFKDKGQISNDLIESVIERLKKIGLVNDEGFARQWVQSRARKYGLQKIKQELYQKGIDRKMIEEVISEQGTDYSEPIAQKLLEKRLEKWKRLPVLEFKKKAYDFLLRRGFEYDLVKRIVEKYIKKG